MFLTKSTKAIDFIASATAVTVILSKVEALMVAERLLLPPIITINLFGINVAANSKVIVCCKNCNYWREFFKIFQPQAVHRDVTCNPIRTYQIN